MPAPTPPDRVTLPAGVCCGHVGEIQLPPPFSVEQRIGQLVDVRDHEGTQYLLSQTAKHWLLHRRLTPTAGGHERNRVELGPPLGFAKPGTE